MSDQNPTTPDPSDAVPGYEPPATSEPATPPSYTPPPAEPEPAASTPPAEPEPPAYVPPSTGYEPPAAAEPPAYEPPAAAEPPAFTAPATGGYEPPATGGYVPPAAGGTEPPGPGAYPPPPPGYGQGPAYGGGFPPPPPGGAYPPPPQDPNGGYAAPSGPAPFSVGAAFNYGWSKFMANAGPILLVVAVAIAATFVVQMIGNAVTAGMSTVAIDPNTGQVRVVGGTMALIVSGLFGLVSYVVAMVVSMGLIRAALDITHGRPISIGSVFRFENLVPFLIAQILVGLMVFVGSLLCVLPGLVLAFFTQFTSYFVLDKNMTAMEAIKASFAMVNANVGSLIGLFLLALVAIIVGALLCGLGLLVAYPVVGIAYAFAFRAMQGEPVAA